MSTITTRSGKGSPLTNNEVDANFTNLNTDKLESGDLSVVTTAVGTAALAYNSGVFTYTPPDLTAIDLSLYAPLAGAVFTGNVEAPLFEGDLTGAILFKGSAGEALTKGDPVYISGISGNKTVVSKADANDANKMPCFGIVNDTVSLNADCSVVTFGTLQGMDTSSFSEGDELYISDTGTLTATAPTGEASQIQKIGKVTRSHASAGSIKVMGAGRTNATPNLNDGNFFLGNASNQAVSADFTTAVRGEISAGTGIGLSGGVISNTAPDQTVALTGAGATSISGTYPNFTITSTDTVYTLPFADNSANWNTAYSWGNHASQSYATQSYVGTAISNLVDSAPATLDTLNELAAALGDDPNFATTVSNSIGTKWTQDNTKISNWDTAYSWGNHASAGYYLASNPNGYTDDQTAAEILTAIKTVDGSGSGLDADLLDGQHETAFLKVSLGNAADLNASTYWRAGMFGWYDGTANRPPDNFGQGLSIVSAGSEHNNSNNWITQLAFGTNETTSYFRSKTNGGAWSDWRTIWNSSNDGSGSGLDADLLDGQQGSYYAPASHNHSGVYLPISGKAADSNLLDGIDSTGFVKQLADGTSPDYQTPSSRRVDPTTSNPTNAHHAISTFGNGGNVTGQLATHFVSGEAYTRGYNNAWSAWRTQWDSLNDGSGSGLDADLLDGIQSSGFHTVTSDPSTPGNGTISIGNNGSYTYVQSHSGQPLYLNPVGNPLRANGGNDIWHAGNDGSGSGLDADLLDGINSTSFLRSDANDTATGSITFSQASQYFRKNAQTNYVSASLLAESYGGAATRTGVGFHISGSIGKWVNMDASGVLRWDSDTFWHSGNDGSGSGLDADLLDGMDAHNGRNSEPNKIVRTDGNGYIQAGWINTDSGDSGIASRLTRIYSSYDNYLRYSTLTDFKVHMGLSAKNSYSRRIDYTSDANYHVGSMGHSGIGANEVFHGGSGFFDIWSSTNLPPSTSHVHGFNALHYTVNSYGSTGGNAYGIQVAGQYNQGGTIFTRGCSGGSFSGWAKLWSDSNDGSGSGLDADLLDGQQPSSLSVNYANSAGSVSWGNVSSKPSYIMSYAGFTLNADTMGSNTTGFTYAVNAPAVGPIARFSTGGNYDMWLNAPYSGGGNQLYFRTRNGDSGTLNAWKQIWHAGNDGSGSGLDADLLDGYNAEETAVNNSIVKRDGNAMVTAKKLYLNGGNYEGSIIFGAVTSWRCGIRQHDDGDAELRIWAKHVAGRVHIATGYDGEPASISKPTDGFVVNYNNVGIGNFASTDPSTKLHVKGVTTFESAANTTYGTPNIMSYATVNYAGPPNYHIRFNRPDGTANGHISTNYYSTTYSTTSDHRVKEDVQPMVDATTRLMSLNPVNFQWKDSDIRTDGFIAHEVAEVVSDAVVGEKDAVDEKGNDQLQALDQSKLVPLLVKTIQEQQSVIEALEGRISALEA